MASHKTFNNMISEFFNDLSETFEDFDVMVVAKNSLTGLLEMDGDNPLPSQMLFNLFGEHEALIASKSAELFSVCKFPFIEDSGEFVMSDVWTTLDADNQDAIWGYIQSLYVMSKSLNS